MSENDKVPSGHRHSHTSLLIMLTLHSSAGKMVKSLDEVQDQVFRLSHLIADTKLRLFVLDETISYEYHIVYYHTI